jgi:hypothetical protein
LHSLASDPLVGGNALRQTSLVTGGFRGFPHREENLALTNAPTHAPSERLNSCMSSNVISTLLAHQPMNRGWRTCGRFRRLAIVYDLDHCARPCGAGWISWAIWGPSFFCWTRVERGIVPVSTTCFGPRTACAPASNRNPGRLQIGIGGRLPIGIGGRLRRNPHFNGGPMNGREARESGRRPNAAPAPQRIVLSMARQVSQHGTGK